MKTLAVSLWLLLPIGEICSACEIVGEVATEPSSKKARITVFMNGKPLPSAKLSIQTPSGHRPVFLDGNGSVTLNDLPVGKTCLTGTDGSERFSALCLAVSKHSSNELSDFGMTLETGVPWFVSPEARVDWVEQAPPSARLRTLKVTILDANDAVVPNAEIQIYKKGSYPQDLVKIAKTNDVGRFEGSLQPGTYTVIFRMRGFRSEVRCIEIARDGEESEMRQTLKVGSDCEW